MSRSLAALILGMASAMSNAATKLDVIFFPSGVTWPLWVAQEKGFFAANGLDVKLTPTPTSVFLVQGLLDGKFQIGHAAFDNVVAYQEGQGEVALPSPPDLCAFMGGQVGGIRLLAQPDIRGIADLKGKALAVDAASTGFAILLRKMLQDGGLGEGDYTFERLGSTAARAQALMEGKTAATIVTSPLDIVPMSKGFRVLADVNAVGRYQSVLGVIRRGWAKENEATVAAYVRSFVSALDWLFDPAHRDDALAIYRAHNPTASDLVVRGAYEGLMAGGDGNGLARQGRIDLAGAQTVLKLRSEFGRPQKDLTDPSKYLCEKIAGISPARP